MTRLSRFLSAFSAIVAFFTLVRSRFGLLSVILWIPKVLACGFSPLASLSGLLGASLGLANRDWESTILGLFGASVSTRYIIKVTESHLGFERAFGPDWEACIPLQAKQRMLSKRWTLRPKDPPQVSWRQDVPIATDPEDGDRLYADLWIPHESTTPSGLVAIYLHGSGWHYGRKDMRTRRFFQHLANQGHLVIDLAYRLAPRVDLYQMIFDVKRAISWAKSNAVDFGVDENKVVLIGGSAGGQLALLAAYTPNDPKFQPVDVQQDTSVCGVVSYYGPTDLLELRDYFETSFRRIPTRQSFLVKVPIIRWEQWARHSGFLPADGQFVSPIEILPSLVGDLPEEAIELYHECSPINHIGIHCPPTFLIQGLHDFAGTVNQVRALHEALFESGANSILVELHNTEHGFDMTPPSLSPATQAATYDTERFLAFLAFT